MPLHGPPRQGQKLAPRTSVSAECLAEQVESTIIFTVHPWRQEGCACRKGDVYFL